MERALNTAETYATWADELDLLQQAHNEGRGITHVRWIVEDLRAGNLEAAKTNYRQQSDKYGRYEDVVAFLEKIGVAEEYGR